MVRSSNNFIGAPNNSYLKSPTADDDIELYISEVEVDGFDDSVYYITDDEVYEPDDTSYVDDTYDEDVYYFSEEDDEDYIDEEDLIDVSNSESEEIEVRLTDTESSSASDKSTINTNATQLDPASDQTNNG